MFRSATGSRFANVRLREATTRDAFGNQTIFSMLRQFKDANGTNWRVWDVYPYQGHMPRSSADPNTVFSAFPSRELQEGWLVFECDNEKRRLAPIPPEWETCEACVLEEFCGRAGYITRLTPPTGS